MSTPTLEGLLMWGQGAEYNAPDDRLVITALSDSGVGVVRRAVVTAASGLNINVAAGWLALADCDDSTVAVVGSRLSHVVPCTAGPSTGARADHLWVDTDPQAGTWSLIVIPESATIGRPGVSLCRITVPQGANAASAFSFDQLVPTFGQHSDGTTRSNSGFTMNALTPHYPIAPYRRMPGMKFRVQAFGGGNMGPTVNHLQFRTALDGSPICQLDTTRSVSPGIGFAWEGWVELQIAQANPALCHIKVAASCGVASGQPGPPGGIPGAVYRVVTWHNLALPMGQWHQIQLQGGFTASSGGQNLFCASSSFETIEPY